MGFTSRITLEYLRRDVEKCLTGLPAPQRTSLDAQPHIEEAAKQSHGSQNLKEICYKPDERRIYADFRPEGSHVYFPVDVLTGKIDHYQYSR